MYRRYVLRQGAAWCCVGALAFAKPAKAAGRVVKAKKVKDEIYVVEGETALGSSANRNFISNAGFVITRSSVVVIDALGSPGLAEELLAEIKRVTPLPVRHVIVTHYHADHIYGLQVLKQAGAQVIAHPAAREYLQSDTARLRLQASREELFPWVDEHTRLIPADRWVDQPRTDLEIGGKRLRIHHVGPAHTPEDLAVEVVDAKVVFCGDLVYRGRIPFVGQADSHAWIASLDRLSERSPQVLVPGHGPVSTSPREDLALTRDYLTYLRHTMGAAARELEPFEEAYARADWSKFKHLPLFQAANRINAYNTYLLMERQPAAR